MGRIMNKPQVGQAIRLGLSLLVCLLFLGTTLTTGPEETDGCSGGHESGTVTIINKSQYDANIRMAGPVIVIEHIPLGTSKTIKIRTGLYHWVANFTYGPHPAPEMEVQTGVAEISEDKNRNITINRIGEEN